MAEVEEEAPSKGGLIKIILMVLVVLLIAVGSAMGALFFTGFFEAVSYTHLTLPTIYSV